MKSKGMMLILCMLAATMTANLARQKSWGQVGYRPNSSGYYKCWACRGTGRTSAGSACSYCGGGGIRNINHDLRTPCGRSAGPYLRSPGSTQCFIATAAYGTPWERNVVALRRFREVYLLTNPIGRRLVALYYNCSPPIADFVRGRAWARSLVCILLTPVAVVAGAMLGNANDILAITMLVLAVLVIVWGAGRARRPFPHLHSPLQGGGDAAAK